jgi:hypothetical protein
MSYPTMADRKATDDEVRTRAAAIRQLAAGLGLSQVRLRTDGTVVVHTPESGYGSVRRLSARATEMVNIYVHVITDDVPGAAGAKDL